MAVGEASPYYLSHPRAAASGRPRSVPEARIVAVLREPVARAHSHYQERVRQGIETLPTFAAAVEAEAGRLAGEVERMLEEPGYVSWNHLNFGYLAQSDYAAGLGRWLAAYPAEQVLVLRSEDFYADDAGVLAQVRGFLGLEATPPAETRQWNRTGTSDLDPGPGPGAGATGWPRASTRWSTCSAGRRIPGPSTLLLWVIARPQAGAGTGGRIRGARMVPEPGAAGTRDSR